MCDVVVLDGSVLWSDVGGPGGIRSIDLVAKLPSCIVGIKVCRGAHHLGRLFAAQGHDVLLMSPEYVRPHVKAQKNDDRDAEGIAESATRPTMRFVEMKTQISNDRQILPPIERTAGW